MDNFKHRGKIKDPPILGFNNMNDEKKAEFEEVWEKSRVAEPRDTVNTEEIEKSLRNVHKNLGFTHRNSNREYSIVVKTLLTAACLLIIIGVGYVMVPKKIAAPPGETATAVLPDGTYVILNSRSELRRSRLFGLISRAVSLEGEAFFDVVSDDVAFTVQTKKSLVEVTGTQFNVRSWPDEAGFDVAVLEGSILWHPLGQSRDTVALKAGQAGFWNSTTNKKHKLTIENKTYYTGWTTRDFAFRNRTLQVIFNELERRFNVTIKLGSNVSPLETLTTYYPNPPDAASILEDICRVKGLQYVTTKNGYKVIR